MPGPHVLGHTPSSFLLKQIGIDPLTLTGLQQSMTTLRRKQFEVSHRAGIGGEHKQPLPYLHTVEGPLGLEKRHGAIEPSHVEMNIGLGQDTC